MGRFISPEINVRGEGTFLQKPCKTDPRSAGKIQKIGLSISPA
jgi:hypothetical protein